MNRKRIDININLVWDKIKSGNEEAFSCVFSFYYSDLYQYGLKIFPLPSLVKDSIQDVFVRIWEKRETLGDVKNPKAYLISSVRRKLFANKEACFSNVAYCSLKDLENQNLTFEASEFIEMKETSKRLRDSFVSAINLLPEKQRELIFLRFYLDLRYAEIARIMDVNEQTVKNMMQRAIPNLRSKIDKQLWYEIGQLNILLFFFFRKF
jgi:RNA polymerase sigma-70 factor (ECF subfamily)